MELYHNPVMLQECIQGLNINPDGIYIDVTYGGGGHSKEILKHLKTGKLIAFDQDADAVQNAVADKRLTFVRENFSTILSRLEEMQCMPVDGLLADLGISSHQIDEPLRGFSTRFDAELDMRMDQRTTLTAKQIVNTYSVEALVKLFSNYGEISNSKQLANAIEKERRSAPINTTEQLKSAIKSCYSPDREHQYMARVFQSLRIEVNHELQVLQELLEQTPQLIKKGGRLVVIAYHSLEDRMVKNMINTGNVEGELQKDFYGNVIGRVFRQLTKKPALPADEELKSNPRSRSARLRIAERI